MRIVTANFQAELDKNHGAQPRRVLEIDTADGTKYYSNQLVTIDAQPYIAIVIEFGNLTSQLVSGEESADVASMDFKLSNIDPIDDLIVAGTVVRVYDWYVGLATVDKAKFFEGTIVGNPSWDDRIISFQCDDIFQKFNKIFGQPVSSASWPNADPDYYGAIIPVLIGAGDNLECIPIEAGSASTLRAEFLPAHTTIQLTSATDPLTFPNTGTVLIGNEEYVYTGVSGGNTLTGVAPHSDIIYPIGSSVFEKVNLKYIAGKSFSDTPVKSITVKGILPFGATKVSDIVAIDATYYTVDVNELISGTYYATIVLTQIVAIRKAVSLAITQQPDQPITTQQTQSSPVHGHTIANRIVSYFMDSLSGSGLGVSNGNLIVDGATVDGSIISSINSGDWLRQSKSLLTDLGGTLVSGIIKIRAWTSSGSISFNFKKVMNGSTLKSESKVATTTPTVFSTSSFSLSSYTWTDFQSANSYIEEALTTTTGSILFIAEVWLELIYTPTAPTVAATINQSVPAASNRITDVSIGGDVVADFVLGRLIVSFEGCKDKTDGHYTGTPTTQPLIEKPPDVIHFLWEKFGNNATHTYFDISGSFLDARTNLPASYKYGVAINWQTSLSVLSAQLAQMAHSRFFTSAGLGKFARILDSGTPIKTINTDDYSQLTQGSEKQTKIKRFGGAIEDVFNKVEIKYSYNPILGSKDNPDAYTGVSESTDAAAAASIAAYGTQRKTWRMWAVRNLTMANDLQSKLLRRNFYPRTITVFPSCDQLSLLEPTDLIELTTDKLRIYGRLSEILIIGNNSQIPKSFQPTEVIITVRDLGVILETLQMNMDTTVEIDDLQNYKETLEMPISATIELEETHPVQHETLQMDMTATIEIEDIAFFLITEDSDFIITEDDDFLVG